MNNSSNTGILIVIAGAAGAGKDAVMEELLKDSKIKNLSIHKVISYTDRPMRPEEKEGVEHYFVSNKKLQELGKENKFVEPITKTGISNKATPKSEILRLIRGENLIWRIDPIRVTDILSGNFFNKVFPEYAKDIQSHTVVFFITAPEEMLKNRRKSRDQSQYNEEAYIERQKEEEPYLKVIREKAINVNNLDGKLQEAVDFLVQTVINFYEKVNK